MIMVRHAKPADATWFATRLRAEDVAEIQAGSGMAPEVVLPLSLESARVCLVMQPDGHDPVAIFGVSDDPINGDLGIVWLLATDAVPKFALGVLQAARMYLRLFLEAYPDGVHNLVDTRNELHRRWCRLLGFSELATMDVRGVPFVLIHKSQKKPNDNHV